MNSNINEIIKTVKDFHAIAANLAREQEENRKTFAPELAEEKNKVLRDSILSRKSQAIIDVRTSAEAAENDIKKASQLQGKDITDDIKLLTAGIKLGTNDLQELADRNAGNETMLRAIKDYADRARVFVEMPPMAADKLLNVSKIRTGALNLIDGIATNPLDLVVGLSVDEFGTAPIFNIA